MSELQADDGALEPVENTEIEAQETEQPEEVSESAPDTGENQEEKVKFSDEQQAIFDKEIGRKVWEAKQAQREKEELERKLAEIQAQQQRPVAEQEPIVPPMPDQWDDDFEVKVRARDEALLKQAEYRAQQRISEKQAQEQEQARQLQAQQELQQKALEFTKRAESLGMTPQELQQAGSIVQPFVSEDVAAHLLADDKGPLMVKYLSSNPLEVDTLSKMTPMQAAVYLENQVKPKAQQFGAKKVSQAPEPVDHLNGLGAAPNRGPKGAKFE